MKAIHYLKVACHFWPWEREFWIGLLHDVVEDGYMDILTVRKIFGQRISVPVYILTRNPDHAYATYILIISQVPRARRVKIADLLENYKRATPSLRKRYAKALLQLA